jgi:hypothetical protein
MQHYFTYDPVDFHFTGHFYNDDAQPENSTTIPVPMCDGDRVAKWEEDKWVVKHLVDGEWVDCTDEIRVLDIAPRVPMPPVIEEEQPVLEANQGE